MNFLKQIFTWWNKQTVGTFLYTLFTGKFEGKDEFENKYYSNSKGKRWVIYNDAIEASKIPAEWHSWIHFLRSSKPNKNKEKFSWQIKHEENLTGSKRAYKPEGSLIHSSKKNMKKYESWKS
jgi:NADH:ubiquinone oxidoreductase subunit